ncbi:type II CAAX endopeptidase family protein [Nocardioides rubriscoriae]|uniref:type II CAAX endopeptidase family protein n=1 Tax=Nocardioides rubriscoriae TaxID=642762 RepID=UPI001FE59BF6|nr:type II CAAX endopeptidase family protein [Nocardioides rubriscoriae]
MSVVVRQWMQRSLWDVVPRDHRDTPEALRRRQVITACFVVLGAIVLGVLLRLEQGSTLFVVMSLVLAAVWTVGALVSGPLHLGRIAVRDMEVRPIVQPLLLGAALAGVFVVGALVVREIEPLADQIRNVLGFASEGYLPVLVVVTAVNGVAEELFFRGAAYAAITRHPVVWTTVAYTIATAATGNIMLAFAAIILGTIVGLQRRASGGILAPIITHCTWSLTMLFALPAIFGV